MSASRFRRATRHQSSSASDDAPTSPDITLRTDGWDHVTAVNVRPIRVSPTASSSAMKKTTSPDDYDDTEIFVQRQFEQIDRNRDGFITVDEAAATIRNLGYSETEAVDFIRTFDRNSDGRVTLAEFRESLSSYSMADYHNMKYHYFFKKLDTDGTGTLSIRELRDFMALIGHNAEIPVLRDFIKSLTNGQSDTIDEETFVKFLKHELNQS